MIRGFYAAGSGLRAQQLAIDNAANNIANVNTTGFKKQTVGFSDLIYSQRQTASGQEGLTGNGVAVSSVNNVITQGAVEPTGNNFDFAIAGEGFFGVQAADGTVRYTRDGSFSVSAEAGGNYLVNSSGYYVLDRNGNRLMADDPALLENIGVFDFDNKYALEHVGGNMFAPTQLSGEAQMIPGAIVQGSLESSNVELSDEMTDLITIQRSFQVNARLIQTADELEGIVNNLR